MRFTTRFFSFLIVVLAVCTLVLADSDVHTTLGLEESFQKHQPAQKYFAASVADSYASAANQPMEAASEAGSAERPVGKMVIAVLMSGVLFGLGLRDWTESVTLMAPATTRLSHSIDAREDEGMGRSRAAGPEYNSVISGQINSNNSKKDGYLDLVVL
ncbi:hypothetical protein OPT61_g160 [Boeremia exigua]|uniref:Uncharacterized protein n=1 Tax=Boeremia exigua TaxID=749465 RepID=A0ACC2IUR3_9PLEO|nr:hypothetical protein OPT61_g160 [Boeremia exigua]